MSPTVRWASAVGFVVCTSACESIPSTAPVVESRVVAQEAASRSVSVDASACDVYVSAAIGSDLNAGTRMLPVRTIRAGIQRAKGLNIVNGWAPREVCVEKGVYPEGPATLEVVDGISVYAGFGRADANALPGGICVIGGVLNATCTSTTAPSWRWTPSPTDRSIILGGTRAVTATNIVHETVLHALAISASPGVADEAGIRTWSVAVYASNAAALVLSNDSLYAAQGADGRDGRTGANGADGRAGRDGSGVDTSAALKPATPSLEAQGMAGGLGGASCSAGGTGGVGGSVLSKNGAWITEAGSRGGESSIGFLGGDGGDGFSSSSRSASAENGRAGRNGTTPFFAATPGRGGGSFGESGATGSIGLAGGSGSGGGGGGGRSVISLGVYNIAGGGGGGGGGGGCPGRGGEGGQGGGGSVALYVIGARPLFSGSNPMVTAGGGGGGAGGAGGKPGLGAAGGAGGAGALLRWSDGFTSRGGDGGNGGRGATGTVGAMGGGGGGGPSCGIYYATPQPGPYASSLVPSQRIGAAGTGGMPNGAPGTRADTCRPAS